MEQSPYISTPKYSIDDQGMKTQRIELTQPDFILIQHQYIQKGLLFSKPQDQAQAQLFPQWIQRLKTTFSKALDIFFPLAGRLVMIQNNDVHLTKSFFIDCNSAGGVSFDHVTYDSVTVADILDPVYIPDDVVYSFFPMNEVSNYQGVSKPLLAAQATELVDGVFIALSMNHSVVDDPPHPVFDRDQFFDCINNTDLVPLRVPFNPDPIKTPSSTPISLKQRMFHFSKENIAKLKAKANAEIVDLPTMANISSLQAVMAHLWVSVTRNRRHLKPEQEVSYIIVVGLRQRTKPPLAESYFGNAVMFGTVKTTAGKLLKNGLGWAALQMNTVVASQTTEKAREYLKNWAESPKLETLQKESGSQLLTGSSPRFNVYGNDFGWGSPLAVRSGQANKYDGKLTVFPGPEQGSIDFEVCLRSETLESMAYDEKFLETLTI
ncbi:uncharacterized acetyltransferase At3g50280-like [Humulus lupulus]|uniref:uncharacterized acetyltransferase At3g50280-like n=1 Tax=Humulus lupulus TaxID=3486 RepID=UPI002B4138D6|nr:uncharacterized acetyltransferase At3g50280-like [Humulus lupulus]